MTNELREAESTPVQLTRIEGLLKGVDYKVSDLLIRMTDVEKRVRQLEADTQALRAEAIARDATALALAKGLKDAEDTRRNQETRTWTPFNKFLAILAAAVALASLWIQSMP